MMNPIRCGSVITLAWLLLVLLAGAGHGHAATLSTAFSYQGRLVAGGSPANGRYDLQLALFNASSAGTQVGATVNNPSVPVTNGLFTTTVDFGPGLFDGTTYWIEVSVRPTGLGVDWRTLQPRQRVAGTPYALYSANSDHANTVPWSGLTGIPAGFADGVDNDTPYTAGTGLSLLNREFSLVLAGPGVANSAARSDHTHSAASIVSGTLPEARIDPLIARDSEILPTLLANDGEGSGLNADFLDGLDSSAFWQLGGNVGAGPGRDSLGTLTEDPLELIVNSERVLRLEPHENGPNVIGGAAINGIGIDVAGATIGGGGTLDDGGGIALSNRVESSYGTVSGGLGNSAGALASSVAGGRNNKIESSADYAVIAGGINNLLHTLSSSATISGGNANTVQTNADYATISGGRQNIIQGSATYAGIGGGNLNTVQTSSQYARIGGGLSNVVGSSSSYATVSGGYRNAVGVNTDYAAVGGGRHNTNGAVYGTIGGGTTNQIRTNAQAATISGGRANVIQAGVTNGTIPGGLSASAANYGQLAYASGSFSVPGDAQSSLYVLRGTTSNSVPTNLALDGVGQQMKIPVGGRWVFEALVLGAMTGSSTNTVAYQLRGSIRNINGVTTMVPGAPSPVSLGADPTASWSAVAVADDPQDALIVRVLGASLGTIRWVATVRTTELIFP